MTEQIIPIYQGIKRDFNWVGFGSGSGTNLRECAKKVKKPLLVFSDKPDADLFKLDELADVLHLSLDGYEACGSWKKAQGDPEKEAEYERNCIGYNNRILNMLRRSERTLGRKIDCIVLGGYMRFVKGILLYEFKDRIVNVHPSPLPLDENNFRMYIGEDAVYNAIEAGEKITRSSVIIVDEKEDHGEILTQGPELKVPIEKGKSLREIADEHQNRQKARSDWPALTTALRLISEGRLALGTENTHFNEWRTVYLDGEPLPYEGFQIEEE